MHRSDTARDFKTPRASHRLTQFSSKRHSLTSNSAQNQTPFRQSAKILVFVGDCSFPSTVIFYGGFVVDSCETSVQTCFRLAGKSVWFSQLCVFMRKRSVSVCASVASRDWLQWFTIQNPEPDFHWEMSLRIKWCSSVTALRSLKTDKRVKTVCQAVSMKTEGSSVWLNTWISHAIFVAKKRDGHMISAANPRDRPTELNTVDTASLLRMLPGANTAVLCAAVLTVSSTAV